MAMTIRKPQPPVSDRLADYLDRPVMLRPREYKVIETQLGPRTALYCDVIVPNPSKGSGEYVNLGETPIFWRGVQSQIDDSIGEWVGGRLHKGTDSNSNAYVLLDPTEADFKLFKAVAGSLEEF